VQVAYLKPLATGQESRMPFVKVVLRSHNYKVLNWLST